jgi:hypothetical protein
VDLQWFIVHGVYDWCGTLVEFSVIIICRRCSVKTVQGVTNRTLLMYVIEGKGRPMYVDRDACVHALINPLNPFIYNCDHLVAKVNACVISQISRLRYCKSCLC